MAAVPPPNPPAVANAVANAKLDDMYDINALDPNDPNFKVKRTERSIKRLRTADAGFAMGMVTGEELARQASFSIGAAYETAVCENMVANDVPTLQGIQATLRGIQTTLDGIQATLDGFQATLRGVPGIKATLQEVLALSKNTEARFVNSNASHDNDPIKPVWKADNTRPGADRLPETYRDFKSLNRAGVVHLLSFYGLSTAGDLGDITTRLRRHLGVRK